MPLVFVRPRRPTTLDELSPLDALQLVAAGKLYDGEDRDAGERLGLVDADAIEMDDDDEVDDEGEEGDGFVLGALEIWDLDDETGAVAYTLWAYNGDAGTLFRAGTTECAADFIQFALRCEDAALATALRAARAALEPGEPATALVQLEFG
jgi:hypothetical protein